MKNSKEKGKKKKEKVVYVDDGSTIADMSAIGGRSSEKKRADRNQQYRAPLKDQFKTFTDAQRAMLLPMLVTLGIIALAFLIVYILL